ncbi:alanine racemase [Clostridium sp.]|uniref:alanine racemase n=1 Tax=Clostridium sp. TaxID=1506 RepID=UPI00399687A4
MSFWCEVYLDRIKHNINKVKELSGNKKVIGVIKANAYGLGRDNIANFIKDNVDILAVGELRDAESISHLEKDILLLSPLSQGEVFKNPKENIILTLDNEEALNYIDKEKQYRVHIYVDTGMNRMGIKPQKLDGFIEKLEKEYGNVKIEGIYTHLHKCHDVEYTLTQIKLFRKFTEKYKEKVEYLHCLASSGLLNSKLREAARFTTAVRAGNIMYGYIGLNNGFKKAYDYYAKVDSIYKVKAGETIGYGALYKAKSNMTIGIIPVGNVHGLGISREIRKGFFYDIMRAAVRAFKERPIIFNNGRPVEIVGKPNMNVTIINFTGCNKDDKFKLEMSPIISDGLNEYRYIINENN